MKKLNSMHKISAITSDGFGPGRATAKAWPGTDSEKSETFARIFEGHVTDK